MGAKQSKRSVDISGKEAEGGGEVAAAGAGGEGRVEPLADADALKPQLNGDAHIQTETDKEKDLDSGTPENEKDATTEKEEKEENEKEDEVIPVSNGEAEEKLENGESTPTPEDGKKPKKEKVKKKWSLRSISFSRKDKPKQEKKQKDEELKTNGEPEKVPEETAEAAAAAEPAAEEIATEASAPATASEAAPAVSEPATTPAPTPAELKEEPVSVPEPLTNGTAASTPSPTEEQPAPVPAPASPTPTPTPAEPAPAPAPEPEQLPVNGLSLEEPEPEVPEVNVDESKPEPPAAETVEIAPEIPAKEVCVQQMPLLESTPPPLPANPPPSSVASFAATTMAPELTPAPVADTLDRAEPHSALPNTQTADALESSPLPPTSLIDATKLPSPLKETGEDMPFVADAVQPDVQTYVVPETNEQPDVPSEVEAVPIAADVELENIEIVAKDLNEPGLVENVKELVDEIADPSEVVSEPIPEDAVAIESKPEPKIELIPELDTTNTEIEDMPLPPPPALDDLETVTDLEKICENGNGDDIEVIPEPIAEPEETIEANHVQVLTNGVGEISFEDDSVTAENAKNKAKAAALAVSENGVDKVKCNGETGDCEAIVTEFTKNEVVDCEVIVKELTKSDVVDCEAIVTEQTKTAAAACEASRESPPPAAEHTLQEPVSVSDKLADLIPELPDVPEINTETATAPATDVAVGN